MKRVIIIGILLILAWNANGQLVRYNIADLDSLQAIEEKPALVFIRTKWCQYCEAIEHSTLTNKAVINELNDSFYFFEFDAESKAPITLKSQRFQYVPTGNNTGIHQLAQALATIEGQIAYPTITFLNSKTEIIYQNKGFITAPALLKLLDAVEGQTH